MAHDHTITIDPIYNGPPDSAHGGVAAGRMAELVDPLRARVRLHTPVPIDAPMTSTEAENGAIEMTADGQRVAAVRALEAPLEVEHFPRLDPHVMPRAEADFLDHWAATTTRSRPASDVAPVATTGWAWSCGPVPPPATTCTPRPGSRR